LLFLQALDRRGYKNEIPLESAKTIFSLDLGFFDRLTLKAYFGSQPCRSIKRIQKLARYSTGTTSYKTIELAQDIPQKRGYLEMLGLVSTQRKGQVWFLKLNEAFVVPEMSSQHQETLREDSIENLSISLEGTLSDRENSEGTEDKVDKTHNIQGERDKNWETPISLALQNQALLKAAEPASEARVEMVYTFPAGHMEMKDALLNGL
jgi:hypothetical protein